MSVSSYSLFFSQSTRSSTPVNWEAVKLVRVSPLRPLHTPLLTTSQVREHITVPCLHNGDVKSLKDAHDFQAKTGVNGVMSARGLLENPALFAGYDHMPLECLHDFVKLTLATCDMSPVAMAQHLAYMLAPYLCAPELAELDSHRSLAGVLDFLEEHNLWNIPSSNGTLESQSPSSSSQ